MRGSGSSSGRTRVAIRSSRRCRNSASELFGSGGRCDDEAPVLEDIDLREAMRRLEGIVAGLQSLPEGGQDGIFRVLVREGFPLFASHARREDMDGDLLLAAIAGIESK